MYEYSHRQSAADVLHDTRLAANQTTMHDSAVHRTTMRARRRRRARARRARIDDDCADQRDRAINTARCPISARGLSAYLPS